MRIHLIIFILILIFPSQALSQVTCAPFSQYVVRIRPPQSAEDYSHNFFVMLLRLALSKTCDTYGTTSVKITDFNVPQGRALKELQRNRFIDVDWAGTNKEREKNLRAIRIPLLGGLLGYRAPIIHSDNLENFSKIKNLQDLKKYTAVQGSHWPDTRILENAGIPVYTTPRFELMYPIVSEKRVDFFPRGLNEVYAEFSKVKDKSLILYDKLLISYVMPMYFFTSKRNKNLAVRIEKGLRMAIEDGSFLELLKSHPATAKMFPLKQYKDALIIHLENPDLPPETPLEDKSLWLIPGGTTSKQ